MHHTVLTVCCTIDQHTNTCWIKNVCPDHLTLQFGLQCFNLLTEPLQQGFYPLPQLLSLFTLLLQFLRKRPNTVQACIGEAHTDQYTQMHTSTHEHTHALYMHTYITSTHTAHAHTFLHVLQDLPLLCCVLAISDPLLELFSCMNTITDSLVGQRVTAHSKLHVISTHWVSPTCMTSSSSYRIHTYTVHCTAAYNLEALYTLYRHTYL